MTTEIKLPPRQTGAERVQAFLNGKLPKNGPELVKCLSLSYTPESKLEGVRDAMQTAWAAGKVLSVQDVLKFLEETNANPGTIQKARVLAETGKLIPPEVKPVPPEDRMLAEIEKEKNGVKR